MEQDSIPRRANWLAELLTEVQTRAPFAVLGSFYRGDMWDQLDMPLATRLHINGNAVYNATNPLLQTLPSGCPQEPSTLREFDSQLAHLLSRRHHIRGSVTNRMNIEPSTRSSAKREPAPRVVQPEAWILPNT